MPVETDADRALFFDPDEFGTTAAWLRDGGQPVPVPGVFDAEPVNLPIGGGGLELADHGPQFTCRALDLPASADDGDQVTVSGVAYTVRTIARDGTGMVVVTLEKGAPDWAV